MKHRFAYVFITWLFLPLLLLAGQGHKKNIAVIDLGSRGSLTKEESGTLTDRLRSMLVRTNAFNVVDRGKMQDILKEQGFQLSGCTSAECAVEAGKILGVEQMVSGTIGRIGKLYTVDVTLIDVETSQIIKSLTRDYQGEIEGLVGLMKSVADELAGLNAPNAAPSGLAVQSNPPQAEVYLDQTLIGETPIKTEDIGPGQHQLKITKAGYVPFEKSFTAQKGKTQTFSVGLKKIFLLQIFSNPAQAEVFINDKYMGLTPYRQKTASGRLLSLQIKKEKYQTFSKDLLLQKDQTLTVNLKPIHLAASQKNKVTKPAGGKSHWWLWVGGGAALAATAAYFLMPKNDNPSPRTNNGFPVPPGRP